MRRRLRTDPGKDIPQWMREVATIVNEISLYRYLGPATVVTTTPYAVLDTDVVLLVDTDAAIEILLPPLALWQGRALYVKDATGAGAGTNAITVTPNGAETIDGGALVINVTRASYTLYGGSLTDWSIL